MSLYPTQKDMAFNEGVRLGESRILKWISVEDRLPEDRVWVWTYSIHDQQDRGCLVHLPIDSEYSWYLPASPVPLDFVTHWMPLPTPPESDE